MRKQRRDALIVRYNGEDRTIKELTQLLHMSRSSVRRRCFVDPDGRLTYNAEFEPGIPLRHVWYNGKAWSVAALARYLRISRPTIYFHLVEEGGRRVFSPGKPINRYPRK
jgi:hypothetical protein